MAKQRDRTPKGTMKVEAKNPNAPKLPANNVNSWLAQNGSPKLASTRSSQKTRPGGTYESKNYTPTKTRPGGTYESKNYTPTQKKSNNSLQMVTSKNASSRPLGENALKEEKTRAERAKKAQEANAKKKQQQAEANERNRQAALAKKQKEQQEKAKREAYNRAFYADKKKKGGKNR